MSQFNLEQLAAALSALGISVPAMDAPPAPDVRVNASADVPAGPLFSIHCSNCAFMNTIPTSAVPTLMGIPLPPPRSRGQPSPANTQGSSAPNLSHHSNLVCPAHSAPAPAIQPAQVPIGPTPIVSSPAPTPGPSQPAPLSATLGPDRLWYVVSKGRAVGVYRGWQTVSNLVTRVGHTCFFCHGTRTAAEAAFNEALAAGAVEIL